MFSHDAFGLDGSCGNELESFCKAVRALLVARPSISIDVRRSFDQIDQSGIVSELCSVSFCVSRNPCIYGAFSRISLRWDGTVGLVEILNLSRLKS